MHPRRSFFRSLLGLSAGAATPAHVAKAQGVQANDPGAPVPVVTPDIADLPFTTDSGVKVFHLVAEPVSRCTL